MKAPLKGTALLRDTYCSIMELLALGFVLWAGLLLMAQCFFWFKTGVWQPAPAMTLSWRPPRRHFMFAPSMDQVRHP